MPPEGMSIDRVRIPENRLNEGESSIIFLNVAS